ncbi:IS110 family transposase [Nocardia aobensis]|uniref:IS110 family transposase n=1 Tax=Nocardia aobensis TaxID=257277 RepID=UPI0002D2DBF1|nr:IS110 family transposase [Nocardia aobensis]
MFAGIDWGGAHHQVCLVDDTGRVLTQKRLRHDVAGFAALDDLLDIPGIRIAIERGEGLLVEHLQLRGLPVYCVSPKISARARERYRLSATKSDTFDAFVLADTLRHEHAHWRSLPVLSAQTAELKAVIRDRERIIWSQRSVESQLRAILDAYHPAPLHLFSSLDRDITLDFLADYPTPEKAARVTAARMDAFCRRHSYTGRVPADRLVERIAPHLLTASEGTTAGKQFTAELFTAQLRLLNQQIRACDKRIDLLLSTHPDAPIFRSFPGIGPVVAATLIAEMGDDRTHYPEARVLLAEAGLSPVTRASGRMHQVRFRYACNHRMRHAIDWWAFVSTRETDWAARAYEQSRARGHGKFRALRGVGARWTRVLWRCWHDNTIYDPGRHTSTTV